MINLSKDTKTIVVEAAAAAGTTELVTDVVDMQGFSSIAFLVLTGDVTSGSVLTITGKTNTANSVSSPTPVTLADTATFTAGATDADSKILRLDLHKPRARYVFASLTRATQNAVIGGIIAILYNPKDMPVTQDATVIADTFVNDPAA